GIVYKARQLTASRLVALKMIGADRLASVSAVERFHTETQAAALLDHPNIVPIFQVGAEEGVQYFSMKLIEGGNLAQRRAEFCLPTFGAQPPTSNAEFKTRAANLARLMARVARAVHYAHQNGILHRDLKPGNILVDADGQPYVSDFGLAKVAANE